MSCLGKLLNFLSIFEFIELFIRSLEAVQIQAILSGYIKLVGNKNKNVNITENPLLH